MRRAGLVLLLSLTAVLIIFAVDLTLTIESFTAKVRYIIILDILDSFIFTVLAIILVTHTIMLACKLKSFKSAMIKDKCMIATLSAVFALSYASRACYLLNQGVWAFLSSGDETCQ